MYLHFRPVKVRPEGWEDHRLTSLFSGSYYSTLQLLDRELEAHDKEVAHHA